MSKNEKRIRVQLRLSSGEYITGWMDELKGFPVKNVELKDAVICESISSPPSPMFHVLHIGVDRISWIGTHEQDHST